MLRTRISICAKRVIQDSQENSLSLIDVIEEINSPAFPFIIPRLSIVWVLERDTGDQETTTGSVVFLNGGRQLNEFPVDIQFQSSNTTRAILVIGGVAIEEPGRIKISFRLNGTEQSTYEFQVNAQTQQFQNGGAATVML